MSNKDCYNNQHKSSKANTVIKDLSPLLTIKTNFKSKTISNNSKYNNDSIALNEHDKVKNKETLSPCQVQILQGNFNSNRLSSNSSTMKEDYNIKRSKSDSSIVSNSNTNTLNGSNGILQYGNYAQLNKVTLEKKKSKLSFPMKQKFKAKIRFKNSKKEDNYSSNISKSLKNKVQSCLHLFRSQSKLDQSQSLSNNHNSFIVKAPRKYNNFSFLTQISCNSPLNLGRKNMNLSQDHIYSKTTRQQQINYLHTLYDKGVIRYKRIQQRYQKNIENKTNDYQLYSFKPNLSSTNNSQCTINVKHQRSHNGKSVYQQQTDWQSFVDKKTIIRKGIEQIEECYQCTFKPKILVNRLQNDDDFINKHINQINDYVVKRRKGLKIRSQCLSNKDLRNNSRNIMTSIEGNTIKNDCIVYNDKIANQKPVIHLRHSSYCNVKNSKKNQLRAYNINTIELIDQMRKSYHIQDFFEENREEEDEGEEDECM